MSLSGRSQLKQANLVRVVPKSAGAGAIGSALGTWAETGDLEKGIMSGIMGYGMGNIFGEIGSGAASTGEQVAADFTEAATQDIA